MMFAESDRLCKCKGKWNLAKVRMLIQRQVTDSLKGECILYLT